MNDPEFQQDRPTVQLLGKEFIIVIVLVFSALSFTLGYFLGKSNPDLRTEVAAQPVPLAPQKQAVALPAQQPLPAPVRTVEHPVQETAPVEQAGQKPQLIVVEENKKEESKRPGPVRKEKTADKVPSAVQPAKGAIAKSAPGDEHSKGSARAEDNRIYAVQLGAFKSKAEAESCRKKFADKKVKSFILTVEDANQEKTYKVRTGEFRDRKQAEALSGKLNETEKFKTYVTLKNE